MKRKGTEGKRREKRHRTHVQRKKLTDQLRAAVNEYVDSAIAESWKGGGDPADIPVLEAQLQLSHARYTAVLDKIERDGDIPNGEM